MRGKTVGFRYLLGLTFSYCCSPIPFVVLLLVLNKNNNKMVERSASLSVSVCVLINKYTYTRGVTCSEDPNS
jgi:hypothetical protein